MRRPDGNVRIPVNVVRAAVRVFDLRCCTHLTFGLTGLPHSPRPSRKNLKTYRCTHHTQAELQVSS